MFIIYQISNYFFFIKNKNVTTIIKKKLNEIEWKEKIISFDDSFFFLSVHFGMEMNNYLDGASC